MLFRSNCSTVILRLQGVEPYRSMQYVCGVHLGLAQGDETRLAQKLLGQTYPGAGRVDLHPAGGQEPEVPHSHRGGMRTVQENVRTELDRLISRNDVNACFG